MLSLIHRQKFFFGLTILFISFFIILPQISLASEDFSKQNDVQTFIKKMVKEHRFKKKYLMNLFSNVKVRQQVITHLKKPLEKQPWHTYQMLFVNEWRIEHGVKFWKKHAAALKKAEKKYGVPASIIVATMGIETKYGKRTGGYRVIDSLTNLGFSDSPRASFFRKELEAFLLLARDNHLDPLKVMGSYAGAIGQPQFMPSSYRAYAVSFSNKGKIDLMNNEEDVIASIANYYNKHGWLTNQMVAEQVSIIGDRYRTWAKNNSEPLRIPIKNLSAFAIVPEAKIAKKILKSNEIVKLIVLQNFYSKEYWIGFYNFKVIRRYNSSDAYAMAVFQLSNYIKALKERLNDF